MDLWHDIRFAVRLLVKERWFTLGAAVALALGIGANAAVFTFVNAVLLRGLPFESPDEIVALTTQDPEGRIRATSELDFEDWQKETATLEGVAAFLIANMNVADEGRPPERYVGAYVTGNLFGLLGQRPQLGRGFTMADDRPGAEPVVILGHSVWQNRYEQDPDIVGTVVRVNSKVATVVGVMPPDMRFPMNNDLWVPRSVLPPEVLTGERDLRNLLVVGRLADGVPVSRAQAELDGITARLADAYPETNEGFTVDIEPYTERANGEEIRVIFWSLQGAVAFVLLIACANVANLLLARSVHRAREVSVRVALGAGRWRIIRQLLVESLILATLAGLGGFGLAVAGVRAFDAATQNVGKPYWMEFTFDPVVFAFIAGICLVTAILFGLAPALHVTKSNVQDVLQEGGRGGSGGRRARVWTRALVVVEVALTLVLLAGAGFMMRSFLVLYQQDLGIDTTRLLTMRLFLPMTRYPEVEQRAEIHQRFEDRLAGIAEIESSTLTSNPPLQGGYQRLLQIDGQPWPADRRPPTVTMVSITDGYFDTLGIEVLRGRPFGRTDGLAGQSTAIVNQRFAALYFGDEDPLGRRILLESESPQAGAPDPEWATIVGLTPSIRQRAFQEPEPDPVVYLPHRVGAPISSLLVVKTRGDPTAAGALVRETMRAIEPDLPLFAVETMDGLLAQQRWMFQVIGSMFGAFAVIALVLAGVGLYAVTAYAVTQRTREIGLRVALGAQPRQVLWLVLRLALVQLAVGVGIGVAGALGVGQVLQSLLVQTSPSDPVTLIGIVLVLLAAAVIACVWPARHAARLEPMLALRYK